MKFQCTFCGLHVRGLHLSKAASLNVYIEHLFLAPVIRPLIK